MPECPSQRQAYRECRTRGNQGRLTQTAPEGLAPTGGPSQVGRGQTPSCPCAARPPGVVGAPATRERSVLSGTEPGAGVRSHASLCPPEGPHSLGDVTVPHKPHSERKRGSSLSTPRCLPPPREASHVLRDARGLPFGRGTHLECKEGECRRASGEGSEAGSGNRGGRGRGEQQGDTVPHGAIRAIAVAGHHGNADKTLCGHAQTKGQTGLKKTPAKLSVWGEITIILKT